MTITLDEAARRPWPVVVVGAGPAGATAARALARRGVDVLLVDRATFPRWKVCGCCLNGNALATLERSGLGDLPARHAAAPLGDMRLSSRGCEARLVLTGGVSLSRETFDAALIAEAVRAGAAFLPGITAALPSPQPLSPQGRGARGEGATTRSLHLSSRDGQVRVQAQVLLAADGLGGTLLARAGENVAIVEPGARIGAGVVSATAPDFYRRGTLYMMCGAGGYLGLVRLEDGRLDLAAAFNADWLRQCGSLGAAAAVLLSEAGWPAPPDLGTLPWRGTPALTRRARRVAAERVFVLGDAAGYVEPFTGEGMAWALASGAAVVPFVLRALSAWQYELIRDWTQCHRRVVRRRQTACRAAAAVLRHPLLAGAVVAVLSRLPALAAPFVRHLNRSSVP